MNALLMVSAFWFLSEVFLAYHKKAAPESIDKDKSSLKLLWIIINVAIGMGLYFGLSGKGFIAFYPKAFYFVGILFIILGLILRWTAIIQLNKYFTVSVALDKNHNLIQHGLYKFLRHPSYTGSLLSFFGLSLCFDNWISFLTVFFPITAVFLYRISIEEIALKNHFGNKYLRYMEKTKRLIPWIY
ncbi:MAG: isoprenylcysteine carboxylmethyltransferase family protein [Deferribacteres bacterium]|nr:isoprenylcysteine carboxylmethyltransferase family protein [candidate division KSB1 bacterium]MCB9501725.1 isoprenylcysteine carboxylmethyltransferase family protein [Deferribacteres bacterium]